LNLNFDMIGSPNFQRGVFNASSGQTDFPTVVNGSSVIQELFEAYFTKENINYTLIPFNGRSDYGSFISARIPAGGLATGAEVKKTPEGRVQFGGFANTAFDPCYHQSCDTLDNINVPALRDMASAAAYVLQQLAQDEELVDRIALSNNRTQVESILNANAPQFYAGSYEHSWHDLVNI